jgi:hypothetical protein
LRILAKIPEVKVQVKMGRQVVCLIYMQIKFDTTSSSPIHLTNAVFILPVESHVTIAENLTNMSKFDLPVILIFFYAFHNSFLAYISVKEAYINMKIIAK